MIYASTPAGKGNFFAGLFFKPKEGVRRITARGTDLPRMAARVARLREQLSATRFRQEVMGEFLSAGLGYFDLDVIKRATNPHVKALVL